MQNATQGGSRRNWIGIVVSAALLVLIFFLVDPSAIWRAMIGADPYRILLVVSMITLFLALRAIRWRFMLRMSAGYWTVFHVQNIGYLFNFLLPARLGDVTRALLIGNVPGISLPQGLSTMIVERVLDLLFMAAFLPLTLSQVESLPAEIRQPAFVAGMVGIILIVLLVVAANQRVAARQIALRMLSRLPKVDAQNVAQRLDDLLQGLDSFTSWRGAITLLALSIIVWVPIVYAYYWTFLAVGLADVSLLMGGFVMCAAAFSLSLPSSPGGVGVYQGGVIFAINTVLGLPADQAAAFAFLHHGLNFLISALLGLIGLRATSATFTNVLATARQFAQRRV